MRRDSKDEKPGVAPQAKNAKGGEQRKSGDFDPKPKVIPASSLGLKPGDDVHEWHGNQKERGSKALDGDSSSSRKLGAPQDRDCAQCED